MSEDMNVSQTGYSIGQDRSFEKEIELSAPGNSNWINIPEKIFGISVTISFTGGASGKIQTSTDLIYTIQTGTPVPVDWPFGVVSETISKRCRPVSGMRAVQVAAGTMKVTMRGQ